MALITFQDKDKTLPTSDVRRLIREEDINEIKSVVNTNAAAMALASSFVHNETPSGTVNGSNTAFTLANTPTAGTLDLRADGLCLIGGGVDYTLIGANITMTVAPTQWIRANYRK